MYLKYSYEKRYSRRADCLGQVTDPFSRYGEAGNTCVEWESMYVCAPACVGVCVRVCACVCEHVHEHVCTGTYAYSFNYMDGGGRREKQERMRSPMENVRLGGRGLGRAPGIAIPTCLSCQEGACTDCHSKAMKARIFCATEHLMQASFLIPRLPREAATFPR